MHQMSSAQDKAHLWMPESARLSLKGSSLSIPTHAKDPYSTIPVRPSLHLT
ncbi:hypothetical protein DPMN_172147 [Dreissena polymorpha]|uniref:Uncharacterized protein n=1 Tax=Dreissena polymorpha TaxID=45954 RepID=A0A9D4E2K0_DREPO|nr:hypothetical protein DPMN_172147 [Dreissena polymorpha]